jgi:DNA-directed RNA polymerase specialized sigma24 family protein
MLLRALDPDAQVAQERLRSIRSLLVRYFEFNGFRDPEDPAHEVIRRVMESLSQGKRITAKNPRSYFFGFAANIRRELWKVRSKESQTLERRDPPDVPARNIALGEPNPIEARVFLRECQDSLEPSERDLLISYYTEGREKLSARLRMRPANLTLQVHRIKKKIRQLVGREKKP